MSHENGSSPSRPAVKGKLVASAAMTMLIAVLVLLTLQQDTGLLIYRQRNSSETARQTHHTGSRDEADGTNTVARRRRNEQPVDTDPTKSIRVPRPALHRAAVSEDAVARSGGSLVEDEHPLLGALCPRRRHNHDGGGGEGRKKGLIDLNHPINNQNHANVNRRRTPFGVSALLPKVAFDELPTPSEMLTATLCGDPSDPLRVGVLVASREAVAAQIDVMTAPAFFDVDADEKEVDSDKGRGPPRRRSPNPHARPLYGISSAVVVVMALEEEAETAPNNNTNTPTTPTIGKKMLTLHYAVLWFRRGGGLPPSVSYNGEMALSEAHGAISTSISVWSLLTAHLASLPSQPMDHEALLGHLTRRRGVKTKDGEGGGALHDDDDDLGLHHVLQMPMTENKKRSTIYNNGSSSTHHWEATAALLTPLNLRGLCYFDAVANNEGEAAATYPYAATSSSGGDNARLAVGFVHVSLAAEQEEEVRQLYQQHEDHSSQQHGKRRDVAPTTQPKLSPLLNRTVNGRNKGITTRTMIVTSCRAPYAIATERSVGTRTPMPMPIPPLLVDPRHYTQGGDVVTRGQYAFARLPILEQTNSKKEELVLGSKGNAPLLHRRGGGVTSAATAAVFVPYFMGVHKDMIVYSTRRIGGSGRVEVRPQRIAAENTAALMMSPFTDADREEILPLARRPIGAKCASPQRNAFPSSSLSFGQHDTTRVVTHIPFFVEGNDSSDENESETKNENNSEEDDADADTPKRVLDDLSKERQLLVVLNATARMTLHSDVVITTNVEASVLMGRLKRASLTHRRQSPTRVEEEIGSTSATAMLEKRDLYPSAFDLNTPPPQQQQQQGGHDDWSEVVIIAWRARKRGQYLTSLSQWHVLSLKGLYDVARYTEGDVLLTREHFALFCDALPALDAANRYVNFLRFELTAESVKAKTSNKNGPPPSRRRSVVDDSPPPPPPPLPLLFGHINPLRAVLPLYVHLMDHSRDTLDWEWKNRKKKRGRSNGEEGEGGSATTQFLVRTGRVDTNSGNEGNNDYEYQLTDACPRAVGGDNNQERTNSSSTLSSSPQCLAVASPIHPIWHLPSVYNAMYIVPDYRLTTIEHRNAPWRRRSTASTSSSNRDGGTPRAVQRKRNDGRTKSMSIGTAGLPREDTAYFESPLMSYDDGVIIMVDPRGSATKARDNDDDEDDFMGVGDAKASSSNILLLHPLGAIRHLGQSPSPLTARQLEFPPRRTPKFSPTNDEQKK